MPSHGYFAQENVGTFFHALKKVADLEESTTQNVFASLGTNIAINCKDQLIKDAGSFFVEYTIKDNKRTTQGS